MVGLRLWRFFKIGDVVEGGWRRGCFKRGEGGGIYSVEFCFVLNDLVLL